MVKSEAKTTIRGIFARVFKIVFNLVLLNLYWTFFCFLFTSYQEFSWKSFLDKQTVTEWPFGNVADFVENFILFRLAIYVIPD